MPKTNSNPRKRPCTWNGIQYDSIVEAANANYITPVGMLFRIQKGYTSDEDMKKPKERVKK